MISQRRANTNPFLARVQHLSLALARLTSALAITSIGALAQQGSPALPMMTGSGPIPVRANSFEDLKGYEWATSAVNILTAEGIIQGEAAGRFNPERPITRAEFAASLARLFNLIPPRRSILFSDVLASSPAYADVEAVAPFMGFSRQQKASMFRPNDSYDRQNAAATLVRILAARGPVAMSGEGRDEKILGKMVDAEKVDRALRPHIAAAIRYGLLASLPGGLRPTSMLTRAEAAVLLQEVEYSFHPLVLDCPALQTATPSLLQLTEESVARPTRTDICRTRIAFSQGSVVTLASGSASQFSALLDRRLPLATAGSMLNKGTFHKIKIGKGDHYVAPRLRADEGTPINGGLASSLSQLGAHLKSGGVPHFFEGFVPPGMVAEELASAGFQQWVAREQADPPPLVGQCPIAFGTPANTSLGNTWTCYVELSVQAVSSTCDWPSINSCTPSGTYTLSADVLRQDENDAAGDRYLVIAQWDTNLGSKQCNWSNVWFGSYACGPYMTDRSVSMPLITLDTNPPSSPLSPPPGGTTGTVMLMPSGGGHGPSSSVCSHGSGVTDTIGGGLSGGVSSSGGSFSTSVTASQGFTQTWNCPDLAIRDNTNDPSGSPNYPPNTVSWVENFDPPHYAAFSAMGPGLDTVSNFQSATEAAVFQLPENSPPTRLSVFGLAHSQIDTVTYVFGAPAGDLGVGETVNLSLTFTLQPPVFFACTWSAFFFAGGICDNPAAAPGATTLTIPQLQVPLGPTGVSIGVFGKELQFGAPIPWTAFSEQSTIVNVVPQGGPNNGNVVTPFQLQPGTCFIADLCDVQITLANPSAAGQQNATVEIPTATPGPNAVDGGPIAFTIVELIVTSVKPNSGPTTGGTSVTLSGSGFSGATEVDFGSTEIFPCDGSTQPCFSVNQDGTQIIITSPPGAAGTVNVAVFAADGAQTEAQFTYTSAAQFLVNAVSAVVSPTSYTGPCPKTYTFTATIMASTAGTVTYTWKRSDGAQGPVETVTFSGPGTQVVSDTWTLSPPSFTGWEQLQILSPNSMVSNSANFTLTCN